MSALGANKTKKIDMTTGSIMQKVFLFAIPIVIANILQQLYTTVDTIVIGHFCGHESLAAVGTSAQPVEVLICVFLGIGTGASILVSQYIGAANRDGIIRLTRTAVSFVYMCGIPVAVIGWFLTPFLLKFMGVPQDAWEPALIYTRIVFLGALGNIGYNMNAGVLRGLGDSKASLWFLLVSCVSNIILDVTFVAFLGMDVGGAALSTSIAMFISWIISIVYIKVKYPELEYTYLPRTIYRDELRKVIALGLPIGLNNSLYSFGHMAMQMLVNEQGSVFMAGASIAGRITGISGIAITAVSQAASTFSGQNFGAGNFSRLREGYLKIPVASGFITLFMGTTFFLLRYPILGIFSDNAGVIMYANRYVSIVLFSQWMYAVFNGIMNIVNGVGKVKYTTVVNLLMLWAVRIPCAYIISRFFDGTYIMISIPVSFFFGMACMIGYALLSPGWKEVISREDTVIEG